MELGTVVILVGLAGFVAVYWAFSPRRLAPGPVLLPFLGSVSMLVEWFLYGDGHNFVPRYRKLYGPVYQFMLPTIFPKYYLGITEPKFIKFVLGNPALFPERPKQLNPFEVIAPSGLFTLPSNEEWLIHRNLLTPILTHKDYLTSFINVMNQVADKFLHKISESPRLEVNSLLLAASFDVISEAAFGFQPNTVQNPHSKFSEAFEHILPQAIAITTLPKLLLRVFNLESKFESNLRTLKEIAETARKTARSQVCERENVVSALEENVSLDNPELSKKEIIDETITIMVAGHETTAHTLSWAIRLLAENPHVQEKAFAEVHKVLGKSQLPNFQMIQDSAFDYLDAIVLETLRIYPTVPAFSRSCAQDVHFEGFFFPKGCELSIAPVACTASEDFWENPKEFRPERFVGLNPAQEASLRINKGFYPFGGGKRMCIGKRFAKTTAVIFLARFLQRFEFKITKDSPVSKGMAYVTLFPEKGVHITCVERN